MKEKLFELGAPLEKLILNPCSPNDIFFNIKSNFSTKKFISIGRLVDKKAPYFTILAFKKVQQKFPDSSLVIGGDGPLFNMCKNLIKHLQLQNNVHLKGILKPEELQNELSTAFAYVQHSLTADNGDMEGTPVSILEACAAGLPVVSTKHAGIKDVIIDNTTGFLVNEHDVDSMSDKMIELLENKELAEKLGNCGKKYVKENFTMQKHILIINQVIAKVLQ